MNAERRIRHLIDRPWRRSSRCINSGCVEVQVREHVVLVRDSKDPSGSVQSYSHDEWADFIAGVKAGEFDLGRQ